MIEVKTKYSHILYYAQKVSFKDVVIPSSYQHFEGIYIPPFYRKEIHLTNVIDLTQDVDTLFSKIKSNTRNEIKRAIKEGYRCEFNQSYSEFISFYNDFAELKSLPKLRCEQDLKQFNNPVISLARSEEDVLAMHATAIDYESKTAMLLYSCSVRLSDNIDRKSIGWANRFLHFKEFEYLKQLGIERYDWNGICIDPEQIEKYNIGLFKQAFGGENIDNVWLFSPLQRIGNYIRKKIKSFQS